MKSMKVKRVLKKNRNAVLAQRKQLMKISKQRAMKVSIKCLKAEMIEIGEEQKLIKQGHKQVRNKFEVLHLEREKLRAEAKILTKQSNNTQQCLNLMSQILRKRADGDFVQADQLAHSLRYAFS